MTTKKYKYHFYYSDGSMEEKSTPHPDPNKVLHRDNGPAAIWYVGEGVDETRYYYQHGKLHRDNGPAIENEKSRTYVWYKDGLRHRLDGPAFNWEGVEIWYKDDLPHREDGPYCRFITTEWALNGKIFETEEEFNKAKREINE